MPRSPDGPISMTLRCSNDACRAPLHTPVAQQWPSTLICSACGETTSLKAVGPASGVKPLERCPACSGVEFFIRRDFPQKIGLLIVIAFGLAATVCYAYKQVVASYAVLAAAVALDALIYLVVGRVTVCYRCRAEFRGIAYNPEHKGFDLATSEKYG